MKPSKPIGFALVIFFLGCFIFVYSGFLSMGDAKDPTIVTSNLPFYGMKLGGVLVACSAIVAIIFHRTSLLWSGFILLGSGLFALFFSL